MGVVNYYCMGGEIIGDSEAGDYMRDALGSVTATASPTTGAVQNTYRYKPYGDLLVKTGSAPDPKNQFVGTAGYRKTSNAHSSSYVRARHLGNEEGMWTTVDPLWPDQRAYIYCSNAPASRQDPTGNEDRPLWQLILPGGNLLPPMPDIPTMWKRCKVNYSNARCLACAATIAAGSWFSTLHRCNHAYIHCMTCCTLARKWNGDCAMVAQNLQNNTPTFGGSDDQKRHRLEYCDEGVHFAALKLDCHKNCLNLHPWVHKPGPDGKPNREKDCPPETRHEPNTPLCASLSLP